MADFTVTAEEALRVQALSSALELCGIFFDVVYQENMKAMYHGVKRKSVCKTRCAATTPGSRFGTDFVNAGHSFLRGSTPPTATIFLFNLIVLLASSTEDIG